MGVRNKRGGEGNVSERRPPTVRRGNSIFCEDRNKSQSKKKGGVVKRLKMGKHNVQTERTAKSAAAAIDGEHAQAHRWGGRDSRPAQLDTLIAQRVQLEGDLDLKRARSYQLRLRHGYNLSRYPFDAPPRGNARHHCLQVLHCETPDTATTVTTHTTLDQEVAAWGIASPAALCRTFTAARPPKHTQSAQSVKSVGHVPANGARPLRLTPLDTSNTREPIVPHGSADSGQRATWSPFTADDMSVIRSLSSTRQRGVTPATPASALSAPKTSSSFNTSRSASPITSIPNWSRGPSRGASREGPHTYQRWVATPDTNCTGQGHPLGTDMGLHLGYHVQGK